MAESSSQETEYEAIEILKERGGRYYIRWAGIDPETEKPWKPTWEPKALANELLVDDWKGKKKKRKRRSSGRNSYRSESISYWSSNQSTSKAAEKTRRSTRLSLAEHSTPSTPSSTPNSRNKRRKTEEAPTPFSPLPSKLPSIHQPSPDDNQQSPAQLNSSQKLKRTVIPETQSDDEPDNDKQNAAAQTKLMQALIPEIQSDEAPAKGKQKTNQLNPSQKSKRTVIPGSQSDEEPDNENQRATQSNSPQKLKPKVIPETQSDDEPDEANPKPNQSNSPQKLKRKVIPETQSDDEPDEANPKPNQSNSPQKLKRKVIPETQSDDEPDEAHPKPNQSNSPQKLKRKVIPETQSDDEPDEANPKPNQSKSPQKLKRNVIPETQSDDEPDEAHPKPNQSNSPQKLKRKVLPETQSDDEPDEANQNTQSKSKPCADPTRLQLASSSPTQDPPQSAADAQPLDDPAVVLHTQDTSEAQGNILDLFSNDSSSHHSHEVEDKYLNLGQANTPKSPSPLASPVNQPASHRQQNYEPDAETAELIASLNDYDDPEHLLRISRYISKSNIDPVDKQVIIKFIADPLSYLADPANDIDALRTQYNLSNALGFELERTETGSINLWLEMSPPKYGIRWDDETVRKALEGMIFRYPPKSGSKDTKTNREPESSQSSQYPKEHPPRLPSPDHSLPSQEPHQHRSPSHQQTEPLRPTQEDQSQDPDVHRTSSPRTEPPHPTQEDESQDPDQHRLRSPQTEPSHPTQEDLSQDPNEHQSRSPQTRPSRATQEYPDVHPSPSAPTEPSRPLQDSAEHQSCSPQNAQPQKPQTAPDSSVRVNSPMANQDECQPPEKQAPSPSRPTDALPAGIQDDAELPPVTSNSSDMHPEPHLPDEGTRQVEPLSTETDTAKDHSQVEPLSNDTAMDDASQMSKEELQRSVAGLRTLLKGALEVNALLESRIPEEEDTRRQKSEIQADLKKEKETVEELRNRLLEQDTEMTKQRAQLTGTLEASRLVQAELTKEKETAEELKSRLQKQDVEMTRQRTQLQDTLETDRLLQAELAKEKKAIEELKSRLLRQDLEMTKQRAQLMGTLEADRLLQAELTKEKKTAAELKNRLLEQDAEMAKQRTELMDTLEANRLVQAEMTKQKETAAELKNRLWKQDVEMTGQRVQLMNSQQEVDQLNTKVKSLQTLLATEEKQPARLLYQKFSDRQKQELAQAQAESRLAKEALNKLQKQHKISDKKNDELIQSFSQQNEDLRSRLELANVKARAQAVQIRRLNVEVKDLEEVTKIQRIAIKDLEACVERLAPSDKRETDDQDETQSSNPATGANGQNGDRSQSFRPISQLERFSLGGPKPMSQLNQSLETIPSDDQEESKQMIESGSQGVRSNGLRSTSHFETQSPHSSPDPRRSCPPPNGQKKVKSLRSSLQYSSSPLCPPRFGTSLTTPTSVAATSHIRPPP
ncbi:hypothetical protein PTTG_25376 [Puccinia triticina 1-1 BBBD Race 1]|uniref:Chromo domain-containing protein n=1 Tax=Puccinia triticina (isolate 1-1 / race 1 (BBBD)) TaxID=630390 RepID=A0A180H4C9_PUCT1|nr:hypothetical protein PTTG_25376 [Puccinia triticina 1-1 BBBD Race 1]